MVSQNVAETKIITVKSGSIIFIIEDLLESHNLFRMYFQNIPQMSKDN